MTENLKMKCTTISKTRKLKAKEKRNRWTTERVREKEMKRVNQST